MDVDDVDGVVRGVRDVGQAGRSVNGGVIEATGSDVRGEIDEAEALQAGLRRVINVPTR